MDTLDSAIAAERGGADRLELCASLCDAGTTPSAGMIAAVKAHVTIPVFAIIRPRGGGFVYSSTEVDVMRRDIEAARRAGTDGLVFGFLTEDGRIDERRTRLLVADASDLPVTFHRAFDMTPDLSEALETVIACGVRRVLTSGGAATAANGAETIARLVAQADGRMVVMAGGGVREESVVDVVRRTGVEEIHVRPTRLANARGAGARAAASPTVRLRKPLPEDEGAWEEIDEARIRTIVGLVNGLRQ